jgi:hypothetical protein
MSSINVMQEPETSAARVGKLGGVLSTKFRPPREMKHEEVRCIFFQKPGKNCPPKGMDLPSLRIATSEEQRSV